MVLSTSGKTAGSIPFAETSKMNRPMRTGKSFGNGCNTISRKEMAVEESRVGLPALVPYRGRSYRREPMSFFPHLRAKWKSAGRNLTPVMRELGGAGRSIKKWSSRRCERAPSCLLDTSHTQPDYPWRTGWPHRAGDRPGSRQPSP